MGAMKYHQVHSASDKKHCSQPQTRGGRAEVGKTLPIIRCFQSGTLSSDPTPPTYTVYHACGFSALRPAVTLMQSASGILRVI